MRIINAIVFDFFGTLTEYDSEVKAFDKMYTPLKNLLTKEEIIKLDRIWWTIYYKNIENSNKTHIEFSMYDVADELILLYNQIPLKLLYEVVDIYMDCWREKVFFCKDALEMIPKLSEKYTLGILSNTHHKTLVPSIISEVNLEHYFSAVALSVEIKNRKPCKSAFYYITNLMSMKPEECCFIGDNYTEDILGAKSVGMAAIQICRKSKLFGTNNDKHFIRNFYELEYYLAQNF